MACWTESRTGSVACQPRSAIRSVSATRLRCDLSNANAHMRKATQYSQSGHLGAVNIALSRTKEGSPAMMTTAAPDKPPDPRPKKPVWCRKVLHLWPKSTWWCRRLCASGRIYLHLHGIPSRRGTCGVPIRDSPRAARRGFNSIVFSAIHDRAGDGSGQLRPAPHTWAIRSYL
jgi:hypothetical protein